MGKGSLMGLKKQTILINVCLYIDICYNMIYNHHYKSILAFDYRILRKGMYMHCYDAWNGYNHEKYV